MMQWFDEWSLNVTAVTVAEAIWRDVPLPKPALNPHKPVLPKKLHDPLTAHSSSDEGWRWLV